MGGLKKRLKVTRELLKRLTRAKVTLDGKPIESLCEIGCYQCCYRMPYVRTYLEEDYLKWKLEQLLKGFPKTQKRLSQKASTAYSVWQDLCRSEGMNPAKPGSPSSLEQDWLGTTTPCILLDFNSPSATCVVHPCAPLDCRMTIRPTANGPCMSPIDTPAIDTFHKGGPINYALQICQKIDRKTKTVNYAAKPLIEVLRWAIR